MPGNKRHGGQSERRSKLADAVEYLFAVMTFIFSIGSITTETAVRRAGLARIQLRCLVGDRRSGTGKAKTVHGSVRVGDEAQSVIERCVTALVNRLAQQQDCTAVSGRLYAQLREGECDGIQSRCTRITWL